MEVSVTRSSHVYVGRISDVGFFNFSKNLNAEIFNLKKNNPKGCNFGQRQKLALPSKSASGFNIRVSANFEKKASKIKRTKPINDVKLFVGLPLDTVSNSNTIKRARAIATGLKALNLLGVDGVELPVWWGIAEKEAIGTYQWSSYLSVVEMVRKSGLKLNISLCFHASQEHKISLPEWVSQIGEEKPDIYHTDQSGQKYKGCLSLGVDDVPVLDGKTPIEVYKEFFESFRIAFSPFLGSTITEISVGLGPDGELRYPSNDRTVEIKSRQGAGDFQCYDKYMLTNLKLHAEKTGNPLRGLGGPHDAPGYDKCPLSIGFFKDNGGPWEMPYGDFFLPWYSNQLISHGDRILSVATSAFEDSRIKVSAKVPLTQSFYRIRSHPSDGFDDVAQLFSRNSCKMILPGIDLPDDESLLVQIASACRKHAVEVSGQNAIVSRDFERIKKKLVGDDAVVDSFTYQRIGADFFSPDHFTSFAQFVRGLNLHRPIRSVDDDGRGEEGDDMESFPGNLHMQTA